MYRRNKRPALRRDVVVIALLYALIGFMVATAYLSVALYIATGDSHNCEVQP